MDVIKIVAIAACGPSNPLHQFLACLSQQAHHLAAGGREGEAQLRRVKEEINRLASWLWGTTHREMDEIQHALEET